MHVLFRSLHKRWVGAQKLALPAVLAYRAPHAGYAAYGDAVRAEDVSQLCKIHSSRLAKHLDSVKAMPGQLYKRFADGLYPSE
jgi:hypothetical protein